MRVAVFPAVLVPRASDGEGHGVFVVAELGDEVGGAVGDFGLGRGVPLDYFGGLGSAGCLAEALGEDEREGGGEEEGLHDEDEMDFGVWNECGSREAIGKLDM